MSVFTRCTDGLIFLCLADNATKTDVAYSFIETIKDRFFRKYTLEQVNKAITFGINFTDELKATIEDYNNSPEPDKAKAVIAELSDVKNSTAENLSIFLYFTSHINLLLDKVLERDIKINVVLAKTAAMKGISVNYKKTVLNSDYHANIRQLLIRIP